MEDVVEASQGRQVDAVGVEVSTGASKGLDCHQLWVVVPERTSNETDDLWKQGQVPTWPGADTWCGQKESWLRIGSDAGAERVKKIITNYMLDCRTRSER